MNIFNATVTGLDVSAYLSKIRPVDAEVHLPLHSQGGYADVFSNEVSSSFCYQNRIVGGVYLGIGSHQNFDHVYRTKPNWVILVDVADEVIDHLVNLRTLFKLTSNPFELLCFAGSLLPIEQARQIKIENDSGLLRQINRGVFDTTQRLKRLPHGQLKNIQTNLDYARTVTSDEFEFNLLQNMLQKEHRRSEYNFLPEESFLMDFFSESFFDGWRQQSYWLRSLEAFDFMRNLAINNRMALIKGNIADGSLFNAVQTSLRGIGDGDQKITVAYFSNVANAVLYAGEYENFVKGLSSLPWDDSPLVLRSYPYLVLHRVDPVQYFYDLNGKDHFFYQVLERQLAKFFEYEPLPLGEEDLIKNILFTEATNRLLEYGESLTQIQQFVEGRWDRVFGISYHTHPKIAFLDLELLDKEYWDYLKE